MVYSQSKRQEAKISHTHIDIIHTVNSNNLDASIMPPGSQEETYDTLSEWFIQNKKDTNKKASHVHGRR